MPRANIVKDEKGDMVADSLSILVGCSILAGWRNHFCQLLILHGINDVRQTKIHTAEPLEPAPSAFEVEVATGQLKRHKSPGIDQILAQMIEAGV